jgi:A/G-specific adenine glycosylase
LLSAQRPGDSNQALMEIGATLCRPRNPLCAQCPLAAHCEARCEGLPESFARRRSGTRQRRVERLVVVVRDGEKVLLFRRPEASAQLAGMWELPWLDADGERSAEPDLADRYGGRWRLGRQLDVVRHAITNRSFAIEIFSGELESTGELAEAVEAGWFDRDEIETLPASSLVRKVLEKAER